MALTVLYRPVGPRELELLRASGWRRWPPRLPEQPIFYPVTNEQYAMEIASRWNVAESGAGYVTKFHVRRDFMERYDVQCVGAAHHTEWWIPAEDLEALNDNIVGTIEVVWSSEDSLPRDRVREPADDSLRVRFEGPSNGWLDVTVTTGAGEWQNVVSYTPNDFLRELVTALLSCADYEDATFEARANTEPEVFLFTFRRHAAVIEFSIRNEAPLLAVSGTFESIVVPFRRALRRLQTSFSEEQWRQPFPEREMAALTKLVEAARAGR